MLCYPMLINYYDLKYSLSQIFDFYFITQINELLITTILLVI